MGRRIELEVLELPQSLILLIFWIVSQYCEADMPSAFIASAMVSPLRSWYGTIQNQIVSPDAVAVVFALEDGVAAATVDVTTELVVVVVVFAVEPCPVVMTTASASVEGSVSSFPTGR